MHTGDPVGAQASPWAHSPFGTSIRQSVAVVGKSVSWSFPPVALQMGIAGSTWKLPAFVTQAPPNVPIPTPSPIGHELMSQVFIAGLVHACAGGSSHPQSLQPLGVPSWNVSGAAPLAQWVGASWGALSIKLKRPSKPAGVATAHVAPGPQRLPAPPVAPAPALAPDPEPPAPPFPPFADALPAG